MFASLFLAGFLTASGSGGAEDRLWRLYERRDFFALQQELPAPGPADSVRIGFLHAQTDSAFGRYEASSRILRALLTKNLDVPLEQSARERLMLNERTMFHYRAALSAIAPVMRSASLRNRVKLLLALQDAPPELSSASAPVMLHPDRFGAVQASVNGAALHLGVDTAANLSVLSRSAARQAGLHIGPTQYRVRLANRKAALADIAVAELRLGDSIRLSHAVFLVLPDSTLRISSHRKLDGLIGLPELSQLGSMRFQANGAIVLNSGRSTTAVESVALIEGDPVVQAKLGAERIFCRIDTGSNRTVFYGSLRKRMRAVLALGGRRIAIQHPVLLPRANQPYVNCSLGRDALRQIEPYTLDLHKMRLTLD